MSLVLSIEALGGEKDSLAIVRIATCLKELRNGRIGLWNASKECGETLHVVRYHVDNFPVTLSLPSCSGSLSRLPYPQ